MKNCKHCYSEIHKRASVCPVCRSNVTFSGTISSFFLTAFPILTAIVSLGFAFSEKYEKGLVQNSLAKTETQLEVAEVRNDVAQEAIATLNEMTPRTGRMMSVAPDPTNPTAPPPTIAEQVKRIDQSIDEEIKSGTIDRQKLKSLERSKLELQNGRAIFHRN